MSEQDFSFVRTVDFKQLNALDPGERFAQPLLDHDSGARTCTISYIRTPPGGGSPAGKHIHEVDQMFFVLAGTMSIEIEGRTSRVEPGSLIVFPAGTPHRNWNEGSEPTVHIAFNAPLPDPNEVFAKPVVDDGATVS
jgi:mannose-6-phosphate isomerase-like protein (cupin superfamily)